MEHLCGITNEIPSQWTLNTLQCSSCARAGMVWEGAKFSLAFTATTLHYKLLLLA